MPLDLIATIVAHRPIILPRASGHDRLTAS
jgi:hypothetical protein